MQINETQKETIINFFDNANTFAISGDDVFIIAEQVLTKIPENNNDEDLIEAIKTALIDYVRENAFNFSFCNYSSAMDYLKKEDSTLCRSLELAEEWGYDLKKINSEILASLLAMKEEIDLIRNFDFKNLLEIIKNKQ